MKVSVVVIRSGELGVCLLSYNKYKRQTAVTRFLQLMEKIQLYAMEVHHHILYEKQGRTTNGTYVGCYLFFYCL